MAAVASNPPLGHIRVGALGLPRLSCSVSVNAPCKCLQVADASGSAPRPGRGSAVFQQSSARLYLQNLGAGRLDEGCSLLSPVLGTPRRMVGQGGPASSLALWGPGAR